MTIWWCNRCHASGSADFDGRSVYDALYELEAAHNEHVLATVQGCAFQTGQVQVQQHPSRGTSETSEKSQT